MSNFYERYDKFAIRVREDLEVELKGLRPPSSDADNFHEAIQLMREKQDNCIHKQVYETQEYLNHMIKIHNGLQNVFTQYPTEMANLKIKVEENINIAQRLRDWALGHKEMNTFPTNVDELLAAQTLSLEGTQKYVPIQKEYREILQRTFHLNNEFPQFMTHLRNAALFSVQTFVLIEFIIDKALTADETQMDDVILKAWAA